MCGAFCYTDMKGGLWGKERRRVEKNGENKMGWQSRKWSSEQNPFSKYNREEEEKLERSCYKMKKNMSDYSWERTVEEEEKTGKAGIINKIKNISFFLKSCLHIIYPIYIFKY